jgi:1,4-dihydroxy-2-naphthoyl-CoA synthase
VDDAQHVGRAGRRSAGAHLPAEGGGVKSIRIDVDGAVGTITIDRRERFNSLDVETARDLRKAGLQLARDASIRAVVLRGNGGVFCSGADLKYIRGGGDEAGISYLKPGNPNTQQPGNPATQQPGNPATQQPGNPAERSGARGGRVFFRACLVDREDLTLDVLAIQTADRGLRLVVIRELEEAEAFGLAGGALGRNVCRLQRSERHREIVELFVRDLFGEIAYINFHLSLLTPHAFAARNTGVRRRIHRECH